MPYIYKITNKINGKIYIGKTIKSIQRRWNEHLSEMKRSNDRPLYRAMNKYGIENFIIEELEEVQSNKEALEREKFWIEFYDSYYSGYNATLGGEGAITLDYEAIYSFFKQNRKINDTARHFQIGEDSVSRVIKYFNDKPEKEGYFLQKAVGMYDLNDNYIMSFNSLREAARFLIEKKSLKNHNESGYASHISSVCKGNRKTCLGYKWKYLPVNPDG